MKLSGNSILLDDFSFSFFYSSFGGVIFGLIILLLAAGLVMIVTPSRREMGLKLYRIMAGGLFIYSGFVKADDPLGFSYKLGEYFESFHWQWAMPLSLPLACVIPVFEMVVGIMALIGARKKLTLWLLFLITLFFACLTLYTALTGKVTECGCFGDAVPMTSWQSFYKNVALLYVIGMIAVFHKHYATVFRRMMENAVIILGLVVSSWFAWHCYNYLPFMDFRPYKIGTDIKHDMQGIPDVQTFYYTLKDKKTGETKEFDKFPDNYQATWDYVSSRTVVTKKGVEPKIKDFNIISPDGNDLTDSVLSYPDYTILMLCSTFDKTNKAPELLSKINTLATECMKNKVKFICLSGSVDKDLADFKQLSHAVYPIYTTDETVLRTMIRANPGFMLIKAGIVIDMWHYHALPDYKSLNEKYFHR